MAVRAMWRGTLELGGTKLPVKLYSAVQDREVRFHLLTPRTHERIRQRMVDPGSGEEVAAGETRKGYPVESGRFVVVSSEELAELRPEPSRSIEIARFVKRERIDHRWYVRPYYLGPDGSVEDDYFALAAVLERRNEEGVAHWVMRDKAYYGSLFARDGYLVLVTLRSADEVIPLDQLEAPSGEKLAERELALAKQVVQAYEDEFRPEDYRNEYRDRVRELVQAKASGSKVKLRKHRPRKPPESLAKALEASLARAKQKPKRAAAGGNGDGKR